MQMDSQETDNKKGQGDSEKQCKLALKTEKGKTE